MRQLDARVERLLELKQQAKPQPKQQAQPRGERWGLDHGEVRAHNKSATRKAALRGRKALGLYGNGVMSHDLAIASKLTGDPKMEAQLRSIEQERRRRVAKARDIGGDFDAAFASIQYWSDREQDKVFAQIGAGLTDKQAAEMGKEARAIRRREVATAGAGVKDAKKTGKTWVEGHYQNRGGKRVWVEGYWK